MLWMSGGCLTAPVPRLLDLAVLFLDRTTPLTDLDPF